MKNEWLSFYKLKNVFAYVDVYYKFVEYNYAAFDSFYTKRHIDNLIL